jgi:hypothetical protein
MVIFTQEPAVQIELGWQDWAAWAPGLEDRAAWQRWATAPWAPLGDTVAAAAAVPPMIRRRLDPLGRAALQVAAELSDGRSPARLTVVSRRGDSARSLALLEASAGGEPVSPTSFGLSVHNAIAAQWVMWQGQREAYTALAAGREGLENAVVDIAAQLTAQPATEALLLVYEAPVPAPYQAYRDEPDALYAFALRLGSVRPGQARLRLSCRARQADPEAEAAASGPPLPAPLTSLAALLRGQARWDHAVDGRHWTWSLDA